MRQSCEERLRIAEIEGAGMVKVLTAKWRAEFDKRKKLHNQVCGGGRDRGGGGRAEAWLYKSHIQV